MCGIIGAVAKINIVPLLLEGLQRLEYRGYDSAGLAVMQDHSFLLKKSKGKVHSLKKLVEDHQITGTIGIAHTRWATHGKPSKINAHPHIINETIALVHNGIIENYQELRKGILKQQADFKFISETDSEIIAAKIYLYRIQGLSLMAAVTKVCNQLIGSYAICVMDLSFPEQIVVARSGSPLVVGKSPYGCFVGSDRLALQNITTDLIYLHDGDLAVLTTKGVKIFDFNGKKIQRDFSSKVGGSSIEPVDKGEYRHFMQKEIFEQPFAIKATVSSRIKDGTISEDFLGATADQVLDACANIQIIACGTSYYAGLVAKRWFEEFAGILCQVDLASEFRYAKRVVLDNTLLIMVSQSGETADTLGALKSLLSSNQFIKHQYCGSLTICNVPESALVRLSELVALTKAGPEIGVASTKAFTTQLTMFLMLLAIFLQKFPKNLGLSSKKIIYWLQRLPDLANKFLQLSPKINEIADLFQTQKSALFLARGGLYPLALEGALKLKEISYIHAEAYPAGELKHGPLALIDHEIPVVVLMPYDDLSAKLHSNIQEVQARGGNLIVFADPRVKLVPTKNLHIIKLPKVPAWLAPILYAIPMQLLAYHVAVLKGTDVDQPRNLAKSVTVE